MIPTDAELIFWIVSAVVGWIVLGILLLFTKKDEDLYVDVEDYR